MIGTSASENTIITGTSMRSSSGVTDWGATHAHKPAIPSRLKMFDPITLPTAMSGLPRRAATSDVTSSGIDVPFFGRPAATAPAIASFALRLNCPVFPIRVIRLGGARFKVSIEKPWHFASTQDHDADVFNALKQINEKLEDWIRERPDQWLWMHRRWRGE